MVYGFSQNFLFDHSWELVNQGIWQKYPNRRCAHVVSVDVLDRSIDPVTGIVRTERVIGCKQKAPLWVLKLLGGTEDAFVREVSFVDTSTRRTTMTTVNLSLSQYINVLERIEYEPSPAESLTKTVFNQTADIQARLNLWKTLGNQLERFSAQRFGDNAKRGREGFEDVLRSLWEQKATMRAES